jgi:hypothetical protein
VNIYAYSSSSSVALQSNVDLRLLSGPLPVSLNLTVPRLHFRFPNGQLFTVTGCQPVAQPPRCRASPPNL